MDYTEIPIKVHSIVKKDLTKCILCQKDTKEKLTSTESGRFNLKKSSEILQDGLLTHLEQDVNLDIQYHLVCYRPYVLRAEKRKIKNTHNDSGIEDNFTSPKIKKKKILQNVNVCIICNQNRFKGDVHLYTMNDANRANVFLNAIRHNMDNVYSKCHTYENVGDILDAGIVSHKACMNLYLVQYKRKIEEILRYDNKCEVSKIMEAFNSVITKLDLVHCSYTVSNIRDLINSKLIDESLENWKVKDLLIKHYGEDICFTYPKDKSLSQTFFHRNIEVADTIETIRNYNPIKECAKILKEECLSYDFGLNESYCDSNDLTNSNKKDRPKSWVQFFDFLFPNRKKSESILRKCDTIFQVAYYILNNNKKRTPLHVSIASTVHDLSRSKQLINIFNRLGFSISYDELLRIDCALCQRTIERSGNHHVPVPPSITGKDIIHGAMDNFDHEENSIFQKSGSHDTILVLFENSKKSDTYYEEKYVPNNNLFKDQRSFNQILECQKLIREHKIGKRAEIPLNYNTGVPPNTSIIENEARNRFSVWLIARYLKNGYTQNVHSFAAINSLLVTGQQALTKIGFTPILPYPATEYDTIFTCMNNFQDILTQKSQSYGALWCDEGVYRLAKELQILNPERFGNIFLGLGGFHMEKIVLSCLGKYLEEVGIEQVLVHNEVFNPGSCKQVMSGSHYIRSKRGMSVIVEALHRLYLSAFFENEDISKYRELITKINNMQNDLGCKSELDISAIQGNWKVIEDNMGTIETDMKIFNEKQCSENCMFSYWIKFLFELYPVICDLTRSHREGKWLLHLSAVKRALPLFFAFNHTNYSRWVPLYYEDCIKLEKKFPLLYSNFLNNGFVVKHTMKTGSGMPMDQALEKVYNKVSKGPGGVIGITRNKSSVAKWNIIKHEKILVTQYMKEICGLCDDDEYNETSLHHEFSDSISKIDEENISAVVKYIEGISNPFKTPHNCDGKLVNIITGKQLDVNTSEFIMSCITKGKERYKEYKEDRLQNKTKKLFDKIPQLMKSKKNSAVKTTIDTKKEIISATRYVDYARLREYDISSLLKYELTSIPFFLTKEEYLKKPAKSKLSKEIKCQIKAYIPEINLENTYHKTMTVIDFMAFARAVPIKKLNILTFGDCASNLWHTFLGISQKSDRIDIVFDLYFEYSIKANERQRRASHDGIATMISRSDQPLPVQMKHFWPLSENKIGFQNFFIKWLIENYNISKPVYLGGGHKDDLFKCVLLTSEGFKDFEILKCYHEEADDRLFFHINQALLSDNLTKVIVATKDTDILVNLVYHFTNWSQRNLCELWMAMSQNEQVPLHNSVYTLDRNVVNILPALHALTGSDTTSQVGSKKEALKVAIYDYQKIESFGKEPFSEDMMFKAEKYLISCLSKGKEVSFNELRFNTFHKKTFKMDFHKLPCTSNSIHQHIARAYIQCYRWINCPFKDKITLNPLNYGYILNDDEAVLIPEIRVKNVIPADFPGPCGCGKCARDNICPCRIKKVACCAFCNCCASKDCKNPSNLE